MAKLFTFFFNLGTPQIKDADEKRRVITANKTNVTLFIIGAQYLWVFPLLGVSKQVFVMIPTIFCFGVSLLLNGLNFFNVSRLLTIAMAAFSTVYFACALGKKCDVQIINLTFIALPFVFFDYKRNKKWLIAGTLFPILCFASLEIFNYGIFPSDPLSEQYVKPFSYTMYAIAATIIAIVLIAFINTFKAYETDLKKAYTVLRHTDAQRQKMATLSAHATLTEGIAHEIRNPLGIMLTNLEALEEAMDEPAQRNLLLKTLERTLLRLKKVLSAMLKYGFAGAKKDEMVDVNAVLKDILVLVQPQAKKKGIKIKSNLCRLPRLKSTQTDIYQVASNLVLNALQSISKGGVLRVRSEKVNGAQDFGFPTAQAIKLTFADTGKGIPADIREKIFDPFYSSKHENLGLGLAMVDKIVTANQGKIFLESEVGKGTEFKVYFPL